MGDELLANTLVPLWLKVAWTAMVVVIVLVYWRHRGPANFLWFSDIAVLALVPGLWLESSFIVSLMACMVLLPEMLWSVSFFGRLLHLPQVTSIADYMFDEQSPLWLRAVSLFHVPLLAVIQHHRAGIACRTRIPRQHPLEVQLGRGHPRQPQDALNQQAIAGTAVIEDMHQRHIGLLAALAVVDHHLNAEGPQGHRRRQRHQPGRPIGPPQQQGGQLQAVQNKAKPCPEQPCRHPGREQQWINRAPGLQQWQIGTRLQLPGVRTDRTKSRTITKPSRSKSAFSRSFDVVIV